MSEFKYKALTDAQARVLYYRYDMFYTNEMIAKTSPTASVRTIEQHFRNARKVLGVSKNREMLGAAYQSLKQNATAVTTYKKSAGIS